MRKFSISLIAAILYLPQAHAQSVDGGDFMRNTGSIYVVVGTVIIALAGIFFTLIVLGRRLTKLENHLKSKNNVR